MSEIRWHLMKCIDSVQCQVIMIHIYPTIYICWSPFAEIHGGLTWSCIYLKRPWKIRTTQKRPWPNHTHRKRSKQITPAGKDINFKYQYLSYHFLQFNADKHMHKKWVSMKWNSHCHVILLNSHINIHQAMIHNN